MNDFLALLQQNIKAVEEIGDKIENEQLYLDELGQYLPILNQMMIAVFRCLQEPGRFPGLQQEFVMEVLNDILYGMEHRDSVFLLDTLRYGLLKSFCYMEKELQSEGA